MMQESNLPLDDRGSICTSSCTSTRMAADRAEIVERIAAALPADGVIEVLPGVRFHRSSRPTDVGYAVSAPELCLVGQGTKEWILGGRTYAYDPGHYLIATTDLPVGTRIVNASDDRPYLGVVIALDPIHVGAVLVEAGEIESRGLASAVDVSPLDARLLNAVLRLLRLADTPSDAGFLGPLAQREIVYLLLTGRQGARLRHIAGLSGSGHRIMAAIRQIRRHFDQPFRIETEAQRLGMSVSTFHHHFRTVTGMSPLEYQKALRLQEARRLMVSEGMDARGAGIQVGYRDASQFTREYKRLFGEPPSRDVLRLRAQQEPQAQA